MTLTLAFAAMIAIPTVANAQDSTPTEKKECCKEKKECSKEKDACCKEEGKACCKDGKKDKRAKSGKKNWAEGRKMNAGKEAKMRRGGGENPMFKGITLTDDQKQKMQALREKNKSAEKKSKADMKAKSKEELQKIRAEFDKEVEKILDKDQLKQYQANKAEMESRRAAKQSKLPKIEKK